MCRGGNRRGGFQRRGGWGLGEVRPAQQLGVSFSTSSRLSFSRWLSHSRSLQSLQIVILRRRFWPPKDLCNPCSTRAVGRLQRSFAAKCALRMTAHMKVCSKNGVYTEARRAARPGERQRLHPYISGPGAGRGFRPDAITIPAGLRDCLRLRRCRADLASRMVCRWLGRRRGAV